MKVTQALNEIEATEVDPRKNTAHGRIEQFFQGHPDEVFRKRDVAKALTLQYNTVKEVIRLLHTKEHKIDRYEVASAKPPFAYYGLPSAIKTLKEADERRRASPATRHNGGL